MGIEFPGGNPWLDEPPKRKEPEPVEEPVEEVEPDIFRDPPRRRYG